MKVFILTLFATAFLSAYASPGGYILKGGVDHRYKHGKPAGYYDAASQAGKLDKILTHATHILSFIRLVCKTIFLEFIMIISGIYFKAASPNKRSLKKKFNQKGLDLDNSILNVLYQPNK